MNLILVLIYLTHLNCKNNIIVPKCFIRDTQTLTGNQYYPTSGGVNIEQGIGVSSYYGILDSRCCIQVSSWHQKLWVKYCCTFIDENSIKRLAEHWGVVVAVYERDF